LEVIASPAAAEPTVADGNLRLQAGLLARLDEASRSFCQAQNLIAIGSRVWWNWQTHNS
jgi:hypothetical protein